MFKVLLHSINQRLRLLTYVSGIFDVTHVTLSTHDPVCFEACLTDDRGQRDFPVPEDRHCHKLTLERLTSKKPPPNMLCQRLFVSVHLCPPVLITECFEQVKT